MKSSGEGGIGGGEGMRHSRKLELAKKWQNISLMGPVAVDGEDTTNSALAVSVERHSSPPLPKPLEIRVVLKNQG